MPGNASSVREVALGLLEDELARLGVSKFVLEGGCMCPVLRQGDSLTVKNSSIEDIRLGDIVVYRQAGRYIVHRFVGIAYPLSGSSPLIHTQADNALKGDPSFGPERLEGKVVEVVRGIRRFRTDTVTWRLLSMVIAVLTVNEARVLRGARRVTAWTRLGGRLRGLKAVFLLVLTAPRKIVSHCHFLFYCLQPSAPGH